MSLPEGFFTRPFAHRGLHGPGIPENSRAAVKAAIAHGYAIEIDLQLSASGTSMVFHDDELDRLTAASGHVNAKTEAELTAIPLKGSAETIPTLPEILALVDGQVPLVLELKDQSESQGPGDHALEEAVAEALRAYEGPVAVMSFNPYSVAAMAALAPHIPRGLTTSHFPAEEWPQLTEAQRTQLAAIPLQGLGASFISHQASSLNRPEVAALKAKGLPILCWTIRTPEEEQTARLYADQITFEGYHPS